MAPSIKLIYFDAKGRAEYIRQTFAAGAVEFEDERIDGPKFKEMKTEGTMIFGSLPVLEVDGVQYGESGAILRYAGKLAGLYPDGALDAMKVDQVVDALETVMVKAYSDKSPEGRAEFVKNDIPRYFAPIDKLIEVTGGSFLLGDKMSVADIKLSLLVEFLEQGILDHVPTDCLSSYTNVVKCKNTVVENPLIAKWNADHKK